MGRSPVFRFCLVLIATISAFAPRAGGAATAIVAEALFDCPGFFNALALIDPLDGDRFVLSGPGPVDGSCTEVGLGTSIAGINVITDDENGDILVADGINAGSRILSVDLATGDRSVVSGCTDTASFACTGSVIGSGGLDTLQGDLVVASAANDSPPFLVAGDILVGMSRLTSCTSDFQSLVRIDPVSGNRTVLAGLADDCSSVVGTGDDLTDIAGITLLADGTLLLSEGTGLGTGRLLTVDPANGNRVVVSGCSDANAAVCVGTTIGTGPVPDFLTSIVPRPGAPNELLARALFFACPTSGGSLMIIDRTTGARSILSGSNGACTEVGGGEPFFNIEALAVSTTGELAVPEDTIGRLFNVDSTTGDRTVLSGCSMLTPGTGLPCLGTILGTGPESFYFGDVTYVPEPSLGSALVAGVFLLRLLDARPRSRRRPSAAEPQIQLR